jgi:predicted dehydrogenase
MEVRMAIRLAQYGVQHGHAAGKALAIRAHPDVEFGGVYEPDATARERASKHRAFRDVRWYSSSDEMLLDPTVVAVAIEGLNAHSLPMAHEAILAGKHLWFDKPAGDDWPAFQEVVAVARRQNLTVQMGYMFRFHDGFQRLAEWARSGLLGDIFSIRAHMSTKIDEDARRVIAVHAGGILYDLAGHMIDQVLWLMQDERPARVTSFLRNDATPEVPSFADNTVGVFEFARGLAVVDIAAMETRPMARRFEVYGSTGSAIMDPMEPATQVRLCLDGARQGFASGVQVVPLSGMSRQRTYELELEAFLATIGGAQPPARSLDHELLVQETLLRATGRLTGT